MPRLLPAFAAVLALAFPPAATASGTVSVPADASAFAEQGRLIDLLRQMVSEIPPKSPQQAGSSGRDSCPYANDMECDEAGIGTGFCAAGTDYNDCWRIAENREDDSCEFAHDGACDEPHFGFGVCTQGSDRTDCGAIAYLRFQTDTCATAFDGVCNEPGEGNGTCEDRTDRSDCLGRDRPMQISDHFFGHDDRELLDTTAFPWTVVGVLSRTVGGTCTATLVAPDVIVTAAHCIETEEGTIDARGTFETGFGLPGGTRTANVVGYLLAADRAAWRDKADNEGTDWALIRLDRPLGDELGYAGARALLGPGAKVVLPLTVSQAGYSWDTGVNLSGHIGCRLVRIVTGNAAAHECDTTHGDSGSPIMVREGAGYFIVATDSAFRLGPDETIQNYAARADGWAPLLADFAAGITGYPIAAKK